MRAVETSWNARRCPGCRTLLDADPGEVFLCSNPSCRLERSRDNITAWNMLIDAQAAEGPRLVEDNKRALRRARKKLVKS